MTEEVKNEKFKITPMVGMLLAIMLVVGILLGVWVGFTIKPADTGTQTNQDDKTNAATVSEADVKDKVAKYLNDNLLKVQGVTGSISELEKIGKSLYKLTVDIKEEGKTTQQAQIYATTDGEEILIGNVNILKTAEPLPKQETAEAKSQTFTKKTDKPEVKLFVMSYCPYGQDAEAAMKPVVELLKDKIEFETHYIAYENYCGYDSAKQKYISCKCEDGNVGADGLCPDGYHVENPENRIKYCYDANEETPKYCSMHGINELNEDVRQVIIQKYFKDKWWDYVTYVNANTSTADIEAKWKDAAAQAGLDAVKIQEYYDAEFLDILKNEAGLATEYAVQGSPSISVNKEEYSTGRDSATLKASICTAFNAQPSECSQEVKAGTAGTAQSGGGCAQ